MDLRKEHNGEKTILLYTTIMLLWDLIFINNFQIVALSQ